VKWANRLTKLSTNILYYVLYFYDCVVFGIIIYGRVQNSRHLYWLFRYFKVSAVILVLCTVASWFTTGYIAYTNKHMPKWVDIFFSFPYYYFNKSKPKMTIRSPTASTTRWRYSTRSTTNRGRDLDRISWACPSDGCCLRPSAKSRWTR